MKKFVYICGVRKVIRILILTINSRRVAHIEAYGGCADVVNKRTF